MDKEKLAKEIKPIIETFSPPPNEDGQSLSEAVSQHILDNLVGRVDEDFIEEAITYMLHEKECICSQWRSGIPTDDGDYITTYGYGSNAKAFSKNKNEQPECTCGLDGIESKLRSKLPVRLEWKK